MPKKGGLERLVRVFGLVMAAEKEEGGWGPVVINSNGEGQCKLGYPSLKCRRAAALYLLEWAQKGMKIYGARMLATDVVTEEDINGSRRKLIVVGSRGRNPIEDMYGQTELPVLAREHPLSRLYMQASHVEGHEGTISTLHRSRKKVWIIGGAR